MGRYRWVVERTLSWLNRFRRLKIRYEHGECPMTRDEFLRLAYHSRST